MISGLGEIFHSLVTLTATFFVTDRVTTEPSDQLRINRDRLLSITCKLAQAGASSW